MACQIKRELMKAADSRKAKLLSRFFKTGKGEYGEGDIFIGVIVPKQRKIAKKFARCSLKELQCSIASKVHEERLTSLLILVEKFKKSDEKEKNKIFNFYLKNTRNINNWDLVDLSAPNILGSYLLEKDKSILYKLAKSSSLWEKRISIISTLAFIRKNEYKDAINLAKILAKDEHDLIHKAVGWMLREVGKKNMNVEENFLKKNYKTMPRTMLRYAIEKFPEKKRRFYMGE